MLSRHDFWPSRMTSAVKSYGSPCPGFRVGWTKTRVADVEVVGDVVDEELGVGGRLTTRVAGLGRALRRCPGG